MLPLICNECLQGSTNENLAHTPPRDWPNKGEIIFEKLKIRYRDNLEFVLKGISATIHPAEKVGIVGRTGAGQILYLQFTLCSYKHGTLP